MHLLRPDYKERMEKRAAERLIRDEQRKLIKAEKRAKKEQRKLAIAKWDAEKKADKIAEKSAKSDARGKLICSVRLDYIGGYESLSRINWMKVEFYERQIIAGGDFIIINAPDVASIEVGGNAQTLSRITVTRMLTLGVFSLAVPKRTTKKDTSLTIGLKDGQQVFFHTTFMTEFELHSKLMSAISHYSRLYTQSQQ